MSKLITALSDSHTISLATMEEASRMGLRTADIDHMLLALALDAGTAGQVLRSMPVTLEAAREATTAQHADQLREIGISAPEPADTPITFHETGGYAWSERALEVLKLAGTKGRGGDAPAILSALLQEPSGLIESLLEKLDTSSKAVSEKLEEALHIPSHPSRLKKAHQLSGSASSFIPASLERVWAALADPLCIPQWDQSTGSIDAPTENYTPQVGDIWEGQARTEFPGGRTIRVKPAYMRREIELIEMSEPHLIEWMVTLPGAPSANARRVRIELEPAAGGTQLRTMLAWEPRSARKRIPGLRLVLSPLYRFSIWMQLTQLGGSISRMFR